MRHGDAAAALRHATQVDAEERAVEADAKQPEQGRRHVEAGPQGRVAGRLDMLGRIKQQGHAEAVDGDMRRAVDLRPVVARSEEHTSELQSLMRISYAVFCLKKKNQTKTYNRYIDYK